MSIRPASPIARIETDFVERASAGPRHFRFESQVKLFEVGNSLSSDGFMNDSGRILWLDCIGGLVFGLVVIALCWPLSRWEGLPLNVVLATGSANLIYGSYSLFVTTRKNRSLKLVKILAAANMFWLVVCVGILIAYWNQISVLGVLHVAGEGIYVSALGLVEWKMKESLTTEK